MSNILYPYTCPHFRSLDMSGEIDNCIHRVDEYVPDTDYYTLGKKCCSLGRKVCFIAIDIDAEGVATNTDDLLKYFHDIPDKEMRTIRVTVDRFFKTIQKGEEE